MKPKFDGLFLNRRQAQALKTLLLELAAVVMRRHGARGDGGLSPDAHKPRPRPPSADDSPPSKWPRPPSRRRRGKRPKR